MNTVLNYKEGTCFCVPLRSSGFARGIVARLNHKGVAFGYFFGPRLESSNLASFDDLVSDDAILSGRFGDLGLLNGEWPILGCLTEWSRANWELPLFKSQSGIPNEVTLTAFDDDTLKPKLITSVNEATIGNLNVVKDSMMGYGFVEIKLTRMLE